MGVSKKASKTSHKTDSGAAPGESQVDFDTAMDQIEAIIEQIESGEIGLEEQIAAYERGAGLLRHCRGLLDAAEQKVQQIDGELERLEGSGPAADESDSQE